MDTNLAIQVLMKTRGKNIKLIYNQNDGEIVIKKVKPVEAIYVREFETVYYSEEGTFFIEKDELFQILDGWI